MIAMFARLKNTTDQMRWLRAHTTVMTVASRIKTLQRARESWTRVALHQFFLQADATYRLHDRQIGLLAHVT
jgi:hypothetical protein